MNFNEFNLILEEKNADMKLYHVYQDNDHPNYKRLVLGKLRDGVITYYFLNDQITDHYDIRDEHDIKKIQTYLVIDGITEGENTLQYDVKHVGSTLDFLDKTDKVFLAWLLLRKKFLISNPWGGRNEDGSRENIKDEILEQVNKITFNDVAKLVGSDIASMVNGWKVLDMKKYLWKQIGVDSEDPAVYD